MGLGTSRLAAQQVVEPTSSYMALKMILVDLAQLTCRCSMQLRALGLSILLFGLTNPPAGS